MAGTRGNRKEAGLCRRDFQMDNETYDILIRLAKLSGYTDEQLKQKKKNTLLAQVLTQVLFETYKTIRKSTLSKIKQEGYYLAKQVKHLKEKKLKSAYVDKYIKVYQPEYFFDVENEGEWSVKLLNKLINNYGDMFDCDKAIESRKVHISKLKKKKSGSKETPTIEKKTVTKKKVSTKKASVSKKKASIKKKTISSKTPLRKKKSVVKKKNTNNW